MLKSVLFYPMIYRKLFGNGSLYGAGICASAAINAGSCVDNVLTVALGYSLYGAACCASAARDASVCNLICHFLDLLVMFS